MRIKGDPRKVVAYFNKTKVYNQGYLKFNIFNKKIKYIIGEHLSNYKSRKIFTELLDLGYFNKKKNEKRSYLYQFKYKKLNKINYPFRGITITFD